MQTRTPPEFTARQLEVMRLVAEGCSSKQIGRELGISRHTVDDHIRKIARRLPPGGSPRQRIVVYYWRDHQLRADP